MLSFGWLSTLGCCAGAVRALERVADKALQLGEAALCGYRSHSSSQCKNAALLHYAVSALPCAPVMQTVRRIPQVMLLAECVRSGFCAGGVLAVTGQAYLTRLQHQDSCCMGKVL